MSLLCATAAAQTKYVVHTRASLAESTLPHDKANADLIAFRPTHLIESKEDWFRISLLNGTVGIAPKKEIADLRLRLYANGTLQLLAETDASRIIHEYHLPPQFGLMPGRRAVLTEKGLSRILPGQEDAAHAFGAGVLSLEEYKAVLNTPWLPPRKLADFAVQPALPRVIATLLPRYSFIDMTVDADDARVSSQPLQAAVEAGALAQLRFPAVWMDRDAAFRDPAYPDGDVQPDFAAEADIIIRAFRHGGVDLQRLVFEDTLLNPAAYTGMAIAGNPKRAHRDLRVLHRFFLRNTLSVSKYSDPLEYEGGDIIFMDRDKDGKDDLCGVVVEDFDGFAPRVVLIRGPGCRVGADPLIGNKDFQITGHYRLLGDVRDFR